MDDYIFCLISYTIWFIVTFIFSINRDKSSKDVIGRFSFSFIIQTVWIIIYFNYFK